MRSCRCCGTPASPPWPAAAPARRPAPAAPRPRHRARRAPGPDRPAGPATPPVTTAHTRPRTKISTSVITMHVTRPPRRVTPQPAQNRPHPRQPERDVNVLGKAIPYGVYDVTADAGWVSVGTDHDTAAFAVESIRRWRDDAGRAAYPAARRLLITADSGGSDSSRTRAWKHELAALALQTGLQITPRHFPPRTPKWNKCVWPR